MKKNETKSFCFRGDFMNQIELLNKEQITQLLYAALAYTSNESYEIKDKLADMAFSGWTQYLDNDMNLSEKRSLAGKNGAKARWNK